MPNPDAPPPADPAAPHEHVTLHGWSGQWEEVARRLFAVPGDLVAAPYAALLLQDGGRADIYVFERDAHGGREVRTRVWTGSGLGTLPARLTGLVLAGGGTHGVTAALGGIGPFADLGVTPAPPSPRGAFGHPLRHYPEDGRLDAYVLAGRRSEPRYVAEAFAKGPRREPRWELCAVTGVRRTVAGALYGLPREIALRDRCLLFLRVEGAAEIHHFARTAAEPGSVTVRVWRGAALGDVPARCLDLLSRGAAPESAGGAVGALLAGLGGWTAAPPSLAPISPRGAFGLPLDTLRAARPTAADAVGAAVLVH